MKNVKVKIFAIKCLITLMFVYSYGGLFLIPNASLTRGIIFSPGPLLILIIILTVSSYSIVGPRALNQAQAPSPTILILLFVLLNLISFCYLLYYKNIMDRTVVTGFETAAAALVYIPLIRLAEGVDNINIDKIFNTISIIAILSISIQIVYANHYNVMFLKSFDLSKLPIRNGGYRVQLFDPLIAIFILNNFNKLLRIVKVKYFIQVIVGLSYLLFISQTRSILMYVLLALAIDYLLSIYAELKKGRISTFNIISMVPLSVGLVYFLKKMIIQLYKPIQDGTYLNDGSYFARIGEFTYYLTKIQENLIFGIGNFSVESVDSIWWSIVHGPTGYYYTQDIGILGDAARLGVGIVPIYLMILFVMFRQQKKSINRPFYGYIVVLLGAIGNYSLLSYGFALGVLLFFNKYYSLDWKLSDGK